MDDKRLFTGDLYYSSPPLSHSGGYNAQLIDELNAEIATEIENAKKLTVELNAFEPEKGGVGEVLMIPQALKVPVLRDPTERLLKVFGCPPYCHCNQFIVNPESLQVYKLYTGYNNDGRMTPVLVFLTDRTLYVTDLIRNKLCNKFVLPYADLDVILVCFNFFKE